VTYVVTIADGNGVVVSSTATTSSSVVIHGLRHGAFYVATISATTPASVGGIIAAMSIQRTIAAP
jgi:hypothetical protein